jgi:hypothetical protein
MTDKEHQLMVHMFAKQTELLASIIEMLKSREVIDSSDFLAYQHLTHSQELAARDLLVATIDQYTAFATALGLQDSLPQHKKP